MGYKGLQCSRLENSMDWGTWPATVHGVARVRHDWEVNTRGESGRSGFVPILLLRPGESQWPRNMAIFLTSRPEQTDTAFVPCQDPLFGGRRYLDHNGAEAAFRKHFWRRAQRERWEGRWNRKRPGTQRKKACFMRSQDERYQMTISLSDTKDPPLWDAGSVPKPVGTTGSLCPMETHMCCGTLLCPTSALISSSCKHTSSLPSQDYFLPGGENGSIFSCVQKKKVHF